MTAKSLRKQLESKRDLLELELVDGGLKSISDIPEICDYILIAYL